MGAVDVPAVGDTGVAAYADAVANQINQMHAFITVANPNVSTPGAGTATWVTMGNVTVPTWATRGRVCLAMSGLSGSAAGSNADVAVKIGTSTGVAHRITAQVITTRFGVGFNDLLTSVPTGSQSVIVQASFVGTGTIAAPSSACLFDLNIDWMQ